MGVPQNLRWPHWEGAGSLHSPTGAAGPASQSEQEGCSAQDQGPGTPEGAGPARTVSHKTGDTCAYVKARPANVKGKFKKQIQEKDGVHAVFW